MCYYLFLSCSILILRTIEIPEIPEIPNTMPRFEVHLPAAPAASSIPNVPAIPEQRLTPHGQLIRDYLNSLSLDGGPLVFSTTVGYADGAERQSWADQKRHWGELATLSEWFRAPLHGALGRVGYFHHPVDRYHPETRGGEIIAVQN